MDIDYPAQLKLLRELQEIDLKLHKDRVSQRAVPNERAHLEAEHRQARAEFDALKNELATTEKRRRKDELELAAAEAHYKEREAKLYAIKTNKEYQAAVKEITEAKRANREREDRILQAMEAIENLTQKIAQQESAIADKDAEYEKKLAELDKRSSALEDEITRFDARRPELLDRLDKAVLRRYDHIRSRYPDALVPIMGGVCSGCSMNIPPQLTIEVMKGKDFKSCPSCHRLIYVTIGQEETTEGA